jgi:3-hydroxybutyryl-CoA dehydrogenase
MMLNQEPEAVAVVGCGQMGAGIAEVSARAGCDVVVLERDDAALAHGRARVLRSLERAARAAKLEEPVDAVMARLRFATDDAALADRQLIVEAIVEDRDAKLELFGRLGRATGGDAILASNTSSIPIMRLAVASGRPERVVGLHFFNPVPVMRLVELIPALTTTDEVAAAVEAFAAERLGKRVVACPDRAGFVVNALLIPYILSAIRMVESGAATAEGVDTAMVEGCAHPMGPLALADLIGLDTTMAVAQSLYDEFREQLYAPPPVLSRMVDAGLLGRKSGRGFYAY